MSTMLEVLSKFREADFARDAGTVDDAVCAEYHKRELALVTAVAQEAAVNPELSVWKVPCHTVLSEKAEQMFRELLDWLKGQGLVRA